MIEQTAAVPRVTGLTGETFLRDYLEKNQPVIVTDAMNEWKALKTWTPDYFAANFGSEQVQVYGDLFRLVGITSLSDYLAKYFGRDRSQDSGTTSVPYVRWYSHLVADDRVPWADDVFRRLKDDWGRPYFYPANSFVLPYCGPTDAIDPRLDWFPARGLFISGAGARTRLHADPWCSDALLCQIYGDKDFIMYDPAQAAYLTNSSRSVDPDAPDLQAFPDFPKAHVTVRDTLHPGEVVLVPAGWFHHFKSTQDSISLTWNFVHRCRLPDFLAYVSDGPPDTELKQLAYAYFESPGRRSLDGSGFLAVLAGIQQSRGPARD